MTEEEAAKLAEECGGEYVTDDLFYMTATHLAMFGDSVQIAEREACAKVCKNEIAVHGDYFADKIRERNNQTS